MHSGEARNLKRGGGQWRNQVHFTGGATRGQALFKAGQQFNDIISNGVII